jgi:hypothetical protein
MHEVKQPVGTKYQTGDGKMNLLPLALGIL